MDKSIDDQELPTEIFEELEYNSKVALKSNLKKFARDTSKYNGRKCTQSGAVNKIYFPEIKKYQVDATQTTSAFTKGADRLRTAACATTEIYEESKHDIDNGGTEDQMRPILERIRRLAVYQFGTGKELDKDCKDIATKALRLSTSLKYLEDEDEEGKDFFFTPETVEKIQKTRFEESVIKGNTQRQFGGYDRYGSPQRGFGRGRPQSSRKDFLFKGRGRGFQPRQATNSFQIEKSNTDN